MNHAIILLVLFNVLIKIINKDSVKHINNLHTNIIYIHVKNYITHDAYTRVHIHKQYI